MAQRKISDTKLQGMAWEHISYEIEMFVQSFDKLRKGNLSKYENNSALETFLIHARILLDFLYPPSDIKPDDTLSDDFFQNPAPFRNSLPKSLPTSEYLKRRTGKEIAHLTYARLDVTPENKKWYPVDIHSQLTDALAIFFDNLTLEQRSWFRVIVKR